jgi:acetylornithine deacetylase/succinyl-diaminopimelate desuccinylase-like protein
MAGLEMREPTMIDSALNIFDRRRQAFLDDLMSFLRFQTISAQPAHASDMRRCAEWIRDQLTAAGLQARILPTAGHPAVFADTGPVDAPETPAKSPLSERRKTTPEPRAASGGRMAPTILVYGHYDVQPVGDPKLWTSPAFEPVVRDGIIYARGAADDKGQVMTHLAAMRCLGEAGSKLPVRIKFILEGEEEIGSPNLPELIQAQRDLLACDYVVLSDTGKLDEETPAIAYSSRGLVYKQITIDGPRKDLHSGEYGGAVANPANVLATIVASLHDERRRVTIPGFYDDVLPLSVEDRRLLAGQDKSDEALAAATGSPGPYGEEGFSAIERSTARPSLDVNGMWSGYTGEGSATIIPTQAAAKVSMRLVANQDPAKISAAFDEAVRRACPPAVRLKIETFGTCAAYVGPTDSPGMRAARKALAESFGREPVLTREGGTLPILPMFKQVLGAESVMLGFASPDCNVHSPNEFFAVSDFETGTRCVLRFLAEMGR